MSFRSIWLPPKIWERVKWIPWEWNLPYHSEMPSHFEMVFANHLKDSVCACFRKSSSKEWETKALHSCSYLRPFRSRYNLLSLFCSFVSKQMIIMDPQHYWLFVSECFFLRLQNWRTFTVHFPRDLCVCKHSWMFPKTQLLFNPQAHKCGKDVSSSNCQNAHQQLSTQNRCATLGTVFSPSCFCTFLVVQYFWKYIAHDWQ